MIDISKHDMIFNPNLINNQNHSVMVVGCGAVGSMVALHLAKLGIQNIHLFDDDRIEPHNIANQMIFGPSNIGQIKVDVTSTRCIELADVYPHPHWHRLTKENRREFKHEYVFCCVDTMAARQTILDDHVLMNGRTLFFGDTRMTAREWRSYAFDPTKSAHVNEYRNEFYPDEEVSNEHTATCRVTPSIAATAGTVANALIWQFIGFVNGRQIHNEICGQVEPWATHVSRAFEDNEF